MAFMDFLRNLFGGGSAAADEPEGATAGEMVTNEGQGMPEKPMASGPTTQPTQEPASETPSSTPQEGEDAGATGGEMGGM
jgi:hypothetical protein